MKPQSGAGVLARIGAVSPYFPEEEGSWALIGYKGSNTVNWIKQGYKNKGQGPTVLAATIPLSSAPPPPKSITTLSKCNKSRHQTDGHYHSLIIPN